MTTLFYEVDRGLVYSILSVIFIQFQYHISRYLLQLPAILSVSYPVRQTKKNKGWAQFLLKWHNLEATHIHFCLQNLVPWSQEDTRGLRSVAFSWAVKFWSYLKSKEQILCKTSSLSHTIPQVSNQSYALQIVQNNSSFLIFLKLLYLYSINKTL